MVEDSNHASRRAVLKTLGAAGISAGLAGCAGSSDSGATETSGSGANTSREQGTTIGGTAGASDVSGVTIEWWDLMHRQSQTSKDWVESIKQKYEEETGNTLSMSYETTQAVQSGTWLTEMEQGKGPIVFDGSVVRMGSFIDAGHVTPWSDFSDQFDSERLSSIEWSDEIVQSAFSGFEGDKIWSMPIGFILQAPIVARADHFEEAGLDIENDFPPESYEDLISTAQKLQEDGPGDYGFQVHGAPNDITDEISPTWAVGIGGGDGRYVNSDWTDTLYDSDAWKTSLKRQVDLFRNKELSPPDTPTASDEDACQSIIDGRASMSQVGMYNYGLFADRAQDELNNGVFQFGPAWEGQSGNRGMFGSTTTMNLAAKPESMDDETWEKKKNAAIQLMEMMLSPEIQKEIFAKVGPLPANRNVWEEVRGQESNFINTAISMANSAEYGWQAHPDIQDIKANIPGPILQRAMNGSISAEEACDQAAEQIRNQIF